MLQEQEDEVSQDCILNSHFKMGDGREGAGQGIFVVGKFFLEGSLN